MKTPILILLFSVTMLHAQLFRLTDTKNLSLQFKGKTVVAGERTALFPAGGFPEAQTLDETVGGARVHNAFGEKDGVKYRRELSLRGDELEVSVQIAIPPYTRPDLDGKPGYQLRIPLKTIAGARYTAITGRAYETTEIRGRLAKGEYGALFQRSIRALYLSGDFGDLAIDCDPKGLNNHGDYGPNVVVGLWRVSIEGDDLVMGIFFRNASYGGECVAKAILFQGTFADHYRRHSHRAESYYGDLNPERNYAFGNSRCGTQYAAVGAAKYSPEAACGWMGDGKLANASYGPTGALYSALCGKADNAFRITNLRQGFHLFTVAASAGKAAVGPFDLSCNGRTWAKGVTVAPNTVKTITFGAWIDDGAAEIGFHGKDWCVSTIGAQLLLSTREDFSFRRGFWVSDQAPAPSVMYANDTYRAAPVYNVKVESFFRPRPGTETAGKLKPFQYPSCHADFSGAEDWRWKYTITNLGPSNSGHFTEFLAPGYLERAIAEHKAKNAKLILINGMLARHNYPAHAERVRKAVKQTIELAHANGMLVMDHIDYSLLRNFDGGFRVLTQEMPILQMTIDTHMPTRGICIANPDYANRFFSNIEKTVRESGLDGIMIDELTYHGIRYCGCQYCREGFHRDTGWYLPVDETSPHLYDRESPLWRAWCRWRQKRLGDAWYAFKSRIKPLNPRFVSIGYSTHHGMIGNEASIGHGAVLEQSSRGWDFIGTEIMPRNIFAVYRSVHCLRKLKNFLRNSMDVPVYGLVYTASDQWDLLYFGWALNNLNGQITWPFVMREPLPGETDFRLFTPEKGDMDRQRARSASQTALLFSGVCRDWGAFLAYPPGPLGTSMLLNDRHFTHDFLSNVNLDAKRLAKYRVFIVNSAQSLADLEVAAMLAFAKNGGTLLLTARTGIKDGNANVRPEWAFAKAFGGLQPKFDKNIQFMKMELGGKTYAFDAPVMGIIMEGTVPEGVRAIGQVYAKNDPAACPLAYETRYGKGRILYTPIEFGNTIWIPEQNIGKSFAGVRYPVCESAANALYDLALVGQNTWDPGDTPEAVLTNLFEVDGKLAIHFLNATGSHLKPGETIPTAMKTPVFPPLANDITFAVARKATKAYAVSPDYDGKRPLECKPLPNGHTQIRLPKELLKAYTIVYIE